MGARAYWLESAHPLCSELVTVRERSIWELRHDPRKDIPYLERIAHRVLGNADELSQFERVKRILQLAIPLLAEDHQQRAASLLFGIEGPYRKAQLNQRQRAAAFEYGVGLDGFRDNRGTSLQHEQTLIRDMSQALLTLAKAGRSFERPIPEQMFGDEPYISRIDLETSFLAAISGDHSVIALIGDVGTGKSKLAYELTFRNARAPSDVCWIRAYDDALLVKDIAAALFQHGVDTSGVDSAFFMKLKFAQQMQRPDGPDFAVFDGTASSDDLDAMLLPSIQTKVIVTSTNDIRLDDVKQITVPDMTDDEARQLVETLIEFVPHDVTSLLMEVAGNRPRVLVQACRLMEGDSHLAAADIARGLRDKPQVLLMLSEPSWRQRLGKRYENLLNDLQQEHPPALALLVMLSLICQDSFLVHRAHLEPLFGIVTGLEDERMARLAFQQALDVLASHSIALQSDTHIGVNVFVGSLIRGLMRASAHQMSRRICSAMEAQVEGISESMDSPRRADDFRPWGDMYKRLREFQEIAPERKPRYGADFFLSDALHEEIKDIFYQRVGVRPKPHREQAPNLDSQFLGYLQAFVEGEGMVQ